MSDSGHIIGEKNPYHPNFNGSLLDELVSRDDLIEILKQQVATLTAERDALKRYFDACENQFGRQHWNADAILDHFNADGSLKGDGKWRGKEIHGWLKKWIEAQDCLNAVDFTEEAVRQRQDCIAALQARNAKLLEAAKAVLDWYDRDGSVGGACDPMEALYEAIGGE